MKYCPKCGQELVLAEVDGVERLKCPSQRCDYVFWNNPIPTVAGVVEYQDKVVLVRQKGWPEKWHGLVTGFLEKGEAPEQGMLRELDEELGLKGDIVEFIGVYSFFELNQLILAYHLKAWGEIRLGDELESYKLIPPGKLRPWSLGTGPALRDWLNARKKTASKDEK
jgi:NADH pyrophosphatase NudC (nudix superfamily)